MLFRSAENLDVVQAPRDAHPVGVLDIRLEHEIVDVVLHVDERREKGEETLARGGGGLNLVGVGKEWRILAPQRSPGTDEVHVVLIGAVFEGDAVLVEFLSGTVQPPILAVEVEVGWLPRAGYNVGLHRNAVDQGVLHLGGPAVLPAVAQIDVVKRVAFGFVREQIPVEVARVFVLEIQPK